MPCILQGEKILEYIGVQTYCEVLDFKLVKRSEFQIPIKRSMRNSENATHL
jgi:hypothetical protein